MPNIIRAKVWSEHKNFPISESDYYSRRQMIKKLGKGLGAMAALAIINGCKTEQKESTQLYPENHHHKHNTFYFNKMQNYYPAKLNAAYQVERSITNEYAATHYNNFYEFIDPKQESIYEIYRNVGSFDTSNWEFEVTGLAENTGKFSLEDIIKKFGLEERVYRFRCVEAWAMTVPWTGIPLSKLIQFFRPRNQATHLRMVTAMNANQMIGVRSNVYYPWPYFEGLTMEEAMNELSFIATGIFGKPLPKQNGAPMRLIVPWKYGYKNIKSIVKFELINYQPETFWHQVAPDEYGFTSNVNPNIPHPRWSQATETLIPDGKEVPTRLYNGYGAYVAHLYE